jgi:hypothetical protein
LSRDQGFGSDSFDESDFVSCDLNGAMNGDREFDIREISIWRHLPLMSPQISQELPRLVEVNLPR